MENLELTGRDLNFVCLCGGNLVYIYTREGGRKVYKCDRSSQGDPHEELLECTICHLPKSIWADDGDVCGNCGLKFLSGQLELTEQQIQGIQKWMVVVQPITITEN